MQISINEAAWTALGITFTHDANFYRFMLPGHPETVDVRRIPGNKLELFPERSARQRKFIALIRFLLLP